MKRSDVFSYIYDFLSFAFNQRNVLLATRKVILFGSVARGDHSKDSDIDIFFDTKSEPKELREALRHVLSEFEENAKNTWHLKGISFPIKPVVGNIENKTWEPLKNDIISYGKVLYGKFEQLPKEISHNYIISYSLTKLDQNKKMKFLRELFGYKNKVNGKLYSQKGLLERIKGEKIYSNSISIPVDSYPEVIRILRHFHIPYKVYEVFLKES